jgi:hypothetical protein
MNDEELKELLHSMRNDPVPPDSLARVRQRVEAQISERGSRFGLGIIWKFAAPAALAACLIALLLRPSSRHTAPAPVQPVVTAGHPTPAPAPPRFVAAASHKHAHPVVKAARHLQPKAPPAVEAASASLIRIETPDPDVVILLLADDGPESHRPPAVHE